MRKEGVHASLGSRLIEYIPGTFVLVRHGVVAVHLHRTVLLASAGDRQLKRHIIARVDEDSEQNHE
jgi:hypothetical protein